MAFPAEKQPANGRGNAMRQKRAQNHKSSGDTRKALPAEYIQRRERMGVEEVVRRILSGSEGELWQLSDDMKGAPSVVVGLPPAVRQTQKMYTNFQAHVWAQTIR